jgi:hypothetical protein
MHRLSIVRFKLMASLLASAVLLNGCIPKDAPITTDSASTSTGPAYAGFTGAISAQTTGATKVRLTWNASTDSNVVAYNIYDATFFFNPKLIATIPAPATSITLTGLANESLYAFRVRAANAENVEDTNTVDVKAIPYAGIQTAQVQSSTSAVIPFNDASNADGVDIYCYTGTTPSYQLIAAITNVNLTQYTISNLQAGVQYTCRAALVINGFIDNNTTTTTFMPLGTASKLVFSTQPGSAIAGSPLSPQPVITIEDANGNVVSAGPDATALVTLTVSTQSPTSGTVSGTASVAAVAGVATFVGVNIQETGLKLITATKGDTSGLQYGSPSISQDSNSFSITAGTVSPLTSTLAVTPAGPLIANGSSSYTVTAVLKDQYGNPVAGVSPQFISSVNNDTLTQPIHPTDSTGTTAGAISTQTVGGTNNNGIRTLSVSSPAGLSSVTTTATFVPGPASQLAFTGQPPSSSPAGAGGITATISVSIEDLYGNLVASTDQTANTNIVLAISTNPSGGTLLGTTTLAATNGVANFTGLGIDKTGNGYKLKASAPDFTTLTVPNSNSFNITSASPTQIKITSGPTTLISSTSGTTGCGAYTIQLEDAAGNNANATTSELITVNTLKNNMEFFSTSNCTGTPNSMFTISQGHSSGTIYMRDPAAEVDTMTAQSSGLTSGSLQVTVTPAQFVISGGPITALSGSCSTAFTLTAQGANGTAGNVEAGTSFNFTYLNSGTSTNATAYSDPNCQTSLGASPATATILNGYSSTTIYFKDSTAEGPILLTFSSPQNNMVNATLNSSSQTVTFIASQLKLNTLSTPVVAGGPCVGPFVVQALDAAGNVSSTANNVLNIVGATSTSQFYASSACSSSSTSITLQSGTASIYVSDTVVESFTFYLTDTSTPVNLRMSQSGNQTISVWPYQLAWTSPTGSTTINTGPLPSASTSYNSIFCLPMTVASQYSNGTNIAPLSAVTVSLNGAGTQSVTGVSYYSDSGCQNPISSISLTSASTTIYFMSVAPGTYNLTASDNASILQTSTSLAITVAAQPAWIGTRETGPSSSNLNFTFGTGLVPVSPRQDAPSNPQSLHFDSTHQYLYVADYNGKVLKYDYINKKYVGWIGGLWSTGSGSAAYNPVPTGPSGVANCNQTSYGGSSNYPMTWCQGGTSNNNWQNTWGDMYYPGSITDDGYNLYVSNYYGGTVQMFNMQTGVFEGWIGFITSTSTPAQPVATIPATITSGTAASSGAPNGATLLNSCSGTSNAVTPGFCSGGTNACSNGACGSYNQTVNGSNQGYGDTPMMPAISSPGTSPNYTPTYYSTQAWATDGRLYRPNAIAWGADSNGNQHLYVAEEGMILMFDGTPGGATQGRYQGWIGVVSTYSNTSAVSSMSCKNGSATKGSQTPGWCVGAANIFSQDTNPSGTGGISSPQSLVVDSVNNLLYVVDAANSGRISAYNLTTGAFVRLIGITSFSGPRQLAQNGSTFYMADQQRVVEMSLAVGNDVLSGWIGKINIAPGNGVCAGLSAYADSPGWCSTSGTSISGFDEGALFQTTGAVYDSGSSGDGNTYILTVQNNYPGIKRWNASTGAYEGMLTPTSASPTQWTTTQEWASDQGYDDKSMYTPAASAVDKRANIMYVVEQGATRVKKINTITGQVIGWIGAITTLPTGGDSACTQVGLPIMQAAPAWCLGALFNPIFFWASSINTVQQNPPAPGTMYYPSGITIDVSATNTYPNYYIYVTDLALARIHRFKADGSYHGWIGWINTSAPLNQSGYNAACPTTTNAFTPGWCYGGNSTWKGDGAGGNISGSSAMADGGMYLPTSIYYNGGDNNTSSTADSNLYVLDYANHRVSRYAASNGLYNGWVGKMGTNTGGCQTETIGTNTVTHGWCTGNSQAAQGTNNGDPGGSIGYMSQYNWYIFNANISGDSTYFYVTNEANNRIDRFWLASGTQGGGAYNAGDYAGSLNSLYTLPQPSGSNGGATWTPCSNVSGHLTCTSPGSWGDVYWNGPSSVFPTGLWVDSAGGNLYYTANGTVIVKRNLSTGSLIGWMGGVSSTPNSCNSGGYPFWASTVTTPTWCQGGSSTNGQQFGRFSYASTINWIGGATSGANYISGDNNFIYITDMNQNRLVRLPK